MLFAAYPSPSGYTPPPKRNANPAVIILGVCGGCVLVGVIIAVIAGVVFNNKLGTFTRRTFVAAQFTTALKMGQYEQAEKQLSPQAQQTYPVDELRKHMDALEAQDGPLTGVSQVTNVQPGQTDFNSIKDLTWNLNFQRGVVALTMSFDTAPGHESQIVQLDWGGGDGTGGANTENPAPRRKKAGGKGGDKSP